MGRSTHIKKTAKIMSVRLQLALFGIVVLACSCGGGADPAGESSGGDDTIGRLAGPGGYGYSAQTGTSSGAVDFRLLAIHFGRPLCDLDGELERLVNPASYVEVDPISGQVLPGYPEVLFGGDDLETLYSFELDDAQPDVPFAPKIVPRNAALQLSFSMPVDEQSLRLDWAGRLTSESPIQLADRLGRPMIIEALCRGHQVVLNAVLDDQVGFPPSPPLFDQQGAPMADPAGSVTIALLSEGTGGSVLRSTSGWPLQARGDILGTPLEPIGFNPGNDDLDFVAYDLSFNGFLPDLSPARIIREITHEGIAQAGSYISAIVDPAGQFNVAANQGRGEWAGALLTMRPGASTAENARVAFNTDTVLFLEDTLITPPTPGVDAYLVRRAEFFEPIPGADPATAVDPVNHPKDPFDPEDAHNSDLVYFMLFDEWNGQDWIPVDYPYGAAASNPISALWRLSLRFSEPMDLGSFQPYETFYVADGRTPPTDPAFDSMHLGRVTARGGHRFVSFEPVLADQFGVLGGDRFVGFGHRNKELRLVIRTIPPATVIEDFYNALGPPSTWPPEVVDDLWAEGVLGVRSLGGRPLGMPWQLFDLNDPHCILCPGSPGRGAFPPAVDLGLGLYCKGDPNLAETGVVVHRFMGLPHTAADPNTGITGVVYNDHDDGDQTHSDNEIYGPRIAEFRIGVSGFLSGHPVEFIEHVFDNYNPPPPSSPSAPDPITGVPFGAGTPINAQEGVRFQHIYRRGDCSPDVPTFQGSVLDLIGLCWAPVGGQVTNTYIKEMSIAMAQSSLGIDLSSGGTTYDEPDTRQSGGIPLQKNSGLKRKFDESRDHDPLQGNVYDRDGDTRTRDEWQIVLGDSPDEEALAWNEAHYNEIIQGSVQGKPYADGRPYIIDQANLFAPPNQGPQFNYYIAYPDFDNPVASPGFGYDSSRGLLIEVRTDDNLGTPVSPINGYAFHPGIITSMLPRFRVMARPYRPATRPSVFAATDPYDVIDPPTDSMGNPSDVYSWNHAYEGYLPLPGSYGDNSRYFAIFRYAKRVSTVESPFLRVAPEALVNPEYLPPVITPMMNDTAPGANLTLWFRAALDETGLGSTDWVLPEEISTLNGGLRPFIQFRALIEGNLDTGEIPFVDSIVIPYEK